MGVITSSNQVKFQSCKSLFAQIREDLDSYDALDLIDNRSLYKYVKKVISNIGMGYYMEKQAVLTVERYKTKLPEDFYLLYSAYRCGSTAPAKGRVLPQGGHVMYLENTCEKIEHCKCDIEKVVDKVTVRHYIDEGALSYQFDNPVLLKITSGNLNQYCSEDSPNRYHQSLDEINITDGYINTNFDSGNIYIKYYGFPFDEAGYPMIPDVESVKTAIEDYIKFKLLEKWWLNNEAPDIERRMAKMEQSYKMSISEALTEAKTPSFQSMLEYRRNTSNRHDPYQFYKI